MLFNTMLFNSSGSDPLDFALKAPGITTKAAWRADDVDLSGSKISQWNDRSGNGNHMIQNNDTNRATFGSSLASMKNQPYASFVSENQQWYQSPDFSFAQGDTAVIIGVMGIGTTTRSLLGSPSGTQHILWGTSTDQISLRGGGDQAIVSENSFENVPFCLEAYYQDGNGHLRINGNLEATGDTGSGDYTNLYMGRYSGGGYWQGNILECNIIDGELSEDAIFYLARYAASRYGIVSSFVETFSSNATFFVPPGIRKITIKGWGAGGAGGGTQVSSSGFSGRGGGGGFAQSDLPVSPEEELNVVIGSGGLGGSGGSGISHGGGGGGYTGVFRSSNPLLIAGGGGGGGGSGSGSNDNGGTGGVGGGLTGGNGGGGGSDGDDGDGGTGGTQSSGGNGGSTTGISADGENGVFLVGGDGAGSGFSDGGGGVPGGGAGGGGAGGGGGGGAGYYGGGGGGKDSNGAGGGGGGSSFVSGSNTTTLSGSGLAVGGNSDDDYPNSKGNGGSRANGGGNDGSDGQPGYVVIRYSFS